ncbi:hypothetical protein A9Q84_04920 [Halobacteriovorax marinus]|uniref:Uncharacterized protein n=1 Tax=Halobacteriovorax marinus TaxID=97084 RepID=A0A1Y5FB28_9BACT|nr:hypothetical protein A9Q84_04920 [Halobacteriovorax marinus]
MGVKKFQNLFKTSVPKKQLKTASVATDSTKPDKASNAQKISDKAEIDSYIKSINTKLKDAEMAKKAAQILEEWIKKK